MFTFQTLEIVGHGGERIPNTYLKQQENASHLGLVLPGIRYTCRMPLLYYASRLLLARHADVLWVEYAYHLRAGFRRLPGSLDERRLFEDAVAASEAALRQHPYQQVTVVGKSLGTLSMAHRMTDKVLAGARGIWLTPLLRDERARARLREAPHFSLIVIGTADGQYDPTQLGAFQEMPLRRVLLVDGADHGLEIRDDMALPSGHGTGP